MYSNRMKISVRTIANSIRMTISPKYYDEKYAENESVQ